MDLQTILGLLAILIGLGAYVFYVRGIIHGDVKPHAFSWFVWGLLTAIAFFAQLSDGGGPGAWVTGFTALASFCFAIVGLHASSRVYIKKSDWIFFTASLAAIPIWYFTGNALWSVILITAIDAAAFAPTFRKAYLHPQTENVYTYALSGVKFIVSICALSSITMVTALYPASLVVANLAFVIMFMLRTKLLRSALRQRTK